MDKRRRWSELSGHRQPSSAQDRRSIPWQGQLPVDHGVPSLAGIGQVDGDLGVLDPTAVPVSWRCTPTVWCPPGTLRSRR